MSLDARSVRPAEVVIIQNLTRWQRHQWARAGYPKDLDSLKRFGRLQRDGTELFEGVVIEVASQL